METDSHKDETSAKTITGKPFPSLPSTATTHGLEAYVPQRRRSGVALCLSGGGYRAALFHLGSMRRLYETGILAQITTVSAVSGGSLLSAYLAAHWDQGSAIDQLISRQEPHSESYDPSQLLNSQQWEEHIAVPFREFAGRNLRTPALLQRLLPWNWFNTSAAVEGLARLYSQYLTSKKLSELPEVPNFIFCATDLAFGASWTFHKRGMGSYQAGKITPSGNWTIAQAVAISSCFPPVFNPWRLGAVTKDLKGGKARKRPDYASCIADLRLNDGGVYDNLGLEPVWKDHQHLLVSDGGSPFGFSDDKGLFSRLLRYQAIISHQARALRKRWLIAGFVKKEFEGAYWGIGSSTEHYDSSLPFSYSSTFIEQHIASIRTDLDAFSEGEAKVLENHGYLLTEAAIQRHCRKLITHPTACIVPHPEWMDESRVKYSLSRSGKTKLLGRF